MAKKKLFPAKIDFRSQPVSVLPPAYARVISFGFDLDAGQVGSLPPNQVTLARDPVPAGIPWFVAGYYKTKIDFQKTEGGWIQTFKLPTAEISSLYSTYSRYVVTGFLFFCLAAGTP